MPWYLTCQNRLFWQARHGGMLRHRRLLPDVRSNLESSSKTNIFRKCYFLKKFESLAVHRAVNEDAGACHRIQRAKITCFGTLNVMACPGILVYCPMYGQTFKLLQKVTFSESVDFEELSKFDDTSGSRRRCRGMPPCLACQNNPFGHVKHHGIPRHPRLLPDVRSNFQTSSKVTFSENLGF